MGNRAAVNVNVNTLRTIVERFGTPVYAYDIDQIKNQIFKLKKSFPKDISIHYSLKANPSLALCSFIASQGISADVSSLGELLIALEAGYKQEQIFVSGPYKTPETIDHLKTLPKVTVSVDSLSELQQISQYNIPFKIVLRLRPTFESSEYSKVDIDSRFGITMDELYECRKIIDESRMKIDGFHIYKGYQILNSKTIINHFRDAVKLAMRASTLLNSDLNILNLGGGFGVPYNSEDRELELDIIGEELNSIKKQLSQTEIKIELGRYIVAPAGWYITKVVGFQNFKKKIALVVDGGVHQRYDICGLTPSKKNNSPIVLCTKNSNVSSSTQILGCLCLPDDLLAESCLLPSLSVGDVLAFPKAGAYGLTASPILFLSHSVPSEVAFDNEDIYLIRERKTEQSLLDGQFKIPSEK